ncbi:MAG TPA: MFS transporter [Mesorhizobium sp.]|jgi:MFS family permease|uniref:MFS transporter n=1 Tax=Mesorhizobium sp. TaxID=1871066 RepID=UPI002DDD1EE3|nr:MFS transporter [Mesorhizobium sp.]HEV2502402.1 MFS transporter [Mesorhizobium sp.]
MADDQKALRLARTIWPYAGLQLASITVNLANAITAVVYPWLVYDLSGNASWMGIIAALTLFPAIFGSAFGGIIAEKVGIRRMALVSVAMGTAAAVGAAAAHDAGMLTIGLLASLALLGAILDGPGGIAIEARVPEIARLARLPLIRANAIDDLVDNGAAIAGPAIAAFLVSVVSTTVLLWAIAAINLLASILVAVSVPRFRLRRIAGSTLGQMKAGLGFIFGQPTLRSALILAGIGTSVFVAVEGIALPAILRTEGRSAALLGMFLAAASAGAIASNVALAFASQAPSLRGIFSVAFAGLAAGVALLLFGRSVPIMIASGAMLGVAAGPLSPVFATLLQSSVPKDLRANVIGISLSLVLLGAPVAALVTGVALDTFGATVVLVACSALLLSCALAALGMRGLRGVTASLSSEVAKPG